MKATYECINCLVNHAKLLMSKISDNNEMSEEKKFCDYRELVEHIIKFSEWGKKPIEMSLPLYELIEEKYGEKDYFINEKTNANQIFLDLYEDLLDICRTSKNPIHVAAKLSAVGNLIDYGIRNSFGELELEIRNLVENKDFSIDMIDDFMLDLSKAKSILYIHDNAGEIVLDKVFIEIIKENYPDIVIHSAVREKPIINDVTMTDVKEINLREVSIPISSGSYYPGTIYEKTSGTFKNIFNSADIIISKGQGNFEGLNGTCDKIYYILMTKCKVISKKIGSKVGDVVLIKDNI